LLLPLAGAALGALAAVEVLAGLDSVVGVAVVGAEVLAGVEAELVVLLELPQPASTSSPAARARIETAGIERVFAAPAVWSLISLISQILRWFGVVAH
jgi:hypothetical protein